MAEEEKNQAEAGDEVAEDTAEPATPSEPAEEAPEPAGNAGESEAEESQAEASDEVAEAASGEVAPELGPKARRRLERSRASGSPRPARTPEERAMERAEEHRASGERRRRYRAARRRKRGEPGTGTPPAPREPGPKKVRQGTVVSAGGDKTITVEIAVVRRHTTYEKVVRRTSKLHAHDEANQAQEGDVVRIVESRPLSRTKRWRLLEILEKAR
jgi:small subunit ribosomal protein S17